MAAGSVSRRLGSRFGFTGVKACQLRGMPLELLLLRCYALIYLVIQHSVLLLHRKLYLVGTSTAY